MRVAGGRSAFDSDEEDDERCPATEHLHVHHLHYRSLGREQDHDCKCLCRFHHQVARMGAGTHLSAKTGRGEIQHMTAFVTERFLLEGAAYALEQCGRLLAAANRENKAGDWATAKALALSAREELGRSSILLDLRREVLGGKSHSAQQVNEACEDHVRKQKAGMKSTVMRAEGNSGLDKLIRARMSAKPGTNEWKEIDEQLARLDRQQQRRAPEERHKQRLAALYIDAISENEWNRPATKISAEEAWKTLTDAINEYRVQYDRYTNLEVLKPGPNEQDDAAKKDLELYNALKAWTKRPTLPLPEFSDFVSSASKDENEPVVYFDDATPFQGRRKPGWPRRMIDEQGRRVIAAQNS
jgi:AbiV family abortive infection protein